MRRLTSLVLAMACLALGASTAQGRPSQATSRQEQQAAADQGTALARFQHDLVSVLALRGEARPLLGAALLARPLPDMPKMLDFHHLVARAAKAPGSGPAVTWARLADCDARAQACPNPAALRALQRQVPDNAAVWLLALARAEHDDKSDAARADLAKAAAAARYDDYAGASLQALADAVTALPPPPDTLATHGPLTSTAFGVQAMIVFGVGSTQPQPGLQATAALCKSNKDDPSVRSDCLKLGKTLEWGSSPLARSLGLHLRETLDENPAAQADARRARRDLVWQVQNFTRLTAKAQTDPQTARQLLRLAHNGGTEMSLMLAALRASHIPTEAPDGWTPHAG